MDNYNKDAYVHKLPFIWPDGSNYGISVDILEDDGSIRNQMIAAQFGENNAKFTAADINRWRDQTKFSH